MFKGVITKQFVAQASAECLASVLISGAAPCSWAACLEARHARGHGQLRDSPVASDTKQPKDENVAVQEQDHIRSRRPRSRFRHFNVVSKHPYCRLGSLRSDARCSYTILTRTLESKILRDRQTFVQLIAHLVGDDLSRSGEIVYYYQTYPTVAKVLTAREPDLEGNKWLQDTYFSHPRIDGMFITNAEGRLIASIPENPAMILNDQISKTWLASARNAQRFYVSPVHPRSPDNRLTTDLVSAIRSADGSTTGFIGVSVLVERIGRRLSRDRFRRSGAVSDHRSEWRCSFRQ